MLIKSTGPYHSPPSRFMNLAVSLLYPHLSSLHNHFRIESVILSFQIGSNFTLFGKGRDLGTCIILVKKQGMNLWYLSKEDSLSSGSRLLLKMLHLYSFKYWTPGPSMSQSCFSTLILHLNDMRPGLPPIVNTNLYTSGFGLTSSRILVSLKRICDPRFNMIRALFVWAT